jgi:hypothetical protein
LLLCKLCPYRTRSFALLLLPCQYPLDTGHRQNISMLLLLLLLQRCISW